MRECTASDSHNHRTTPFTVALTGGIASGKTAVSNAFGILGIPIIDTDRIAHELVEPGQPLLDKVIQVFGPNLLDEAGRLRRRQLREIVFADPARRQQLEALLHPAILQEAQDRIEQATGTYCIIVIPLLAEGGVADWIDRVLVVDVDEAIQVERVMRRDGTGRQQALAALDAQASRQERLAIADDVIDNSGSLGDLEAAVAELHQKYLDQAA